MPESAERERVERERLRFIVLTKPLALLWLWLGLHKSGQCLELTNQTIKTAPFRYLMSTDQGVPGGRSTRWTSTSSYVSSGHYPSETDNDMDFHNSYGHDKGPTCSTKDHHLEGPGGQREGV